MLCGLPACGESDGTGPPPQPPPPAPPTVLAGFTPWPYEATAAAVDDVYDKIRLHGNLSVHHLDGGVPWPEAHAGSSYHPNVEAELSSRVARLVPGRPVYLALAPLNSERDGLANYWGESSNLPRPGEWAARDFVDPAVATAYTNYALDLVARFDPDYLNYGIEVSELALTDPDAFDDFAVFAATVYAAIKAARPALPVFVSVVLKHPDSPEAAQIRARFGALAPLTDLVGLSVYPYIFFGHANAGDPATLPPDWLTQARGLAPGKPLGIAETAWIAEDLSIPQFGVSVAGTPAWQQAYVERLFSAAEAESLEFVVWWAVQDFDRLWSETLGEDPLARIWRDTGLYDESGASRPGLDSWDSLLGRVP